MTTAEVVKAAREKKCVQALQSFTYQDPVIGPVRIQRGESADAWHIAVRMHPEKFGPDGSVNVKAKRTRDYLTDSRPAWQRGDVLPNPPGLLGAPGKLNATEAAERRHSTSPHSVQVVSSVRDAIEAEIAATPEDYETGGLLLGRRDGSRASVTVTEAWGPGWVSERRRNSVNLDWDAEYARAARVYEESERTIAPVGFWHLHPRPADSDEPSDPDLRSFGALFERTDAIAPTSLFVGLIAVPNERAWGVPHIGEWIVRRSDEYNRPLVCERAKGR